MPFCDSVILLVFAGHRAQHVQQPEGGAEVALWL